MGNIVKKVVNKVFRLLNGSGKAVDSGNAEQVKSWFKVDGDKTLRLNYPLSENSIVMDLGGYKGDWSNDIFVRYRPFILVFEPYIPFYEKIKSRFKANPKIKAFPFGLSGKTQTVQFSVSDDGSSIFDIDNQKVDVQLKSVKEFINEQKIDSVDLIKINIEGGEYDLLEALIEENLIHLFNNIQIQFHNFFPEAKQRMNKIQEHLQKTHELTYQFEFVWENWKLKK